MLSRGIGEAGGSGAAGDRVVRDNDGAEEVGDCTDDGAADGPIAYNDQFGL